MKSGSCCERGHLSDFNTGRRILYFRRGRFGSNPTHLGRYRRRNRSGTSSHIPISGQGLGS